MERSVGFLVWLEDDDLFYGDELLARTFSSHCLKLMAVEIKLKQLDYNNANE